MSIDTDADANVVHLPKRSKQPRPAATGKRPSPSLETHERMLRERWRKFVDAARIMHLAARCLAIDPEKAVYHRSELEPLAALAAAVLLALEEIEQAPSS